MVYLVQAVAKVNEQTSPSLDENFHPDELLATLEGVDTVEGAIGPLGLAEVIPDPDAQAVLANFLAKLPRAVDRTIVGVTRDALQRGLRVALSWQPAVVTQVLVFETTKKEDGVEKGAVHLVLFCPDPETAAGLTPQP
jgi:hypothetical protein